MQITIIDYGMGNVHSVQNAISFLGYNSNVTNKLDAISKSDFLILPGVGAFGQGIDELKKRDLIEAILFFIKKGNPFLCICLGMQLLFEISYEHGAFEGVVIDDGKDWKNNDEQTHKPGKNFPF